MPGFKFKPLATEKPGVSAKAGAQEGDLHWGPWTLALVWSSDSHSMHLGREPQDGSSVLVGVSPLKKIFFNSFLNRKKKTFFS